MVFLWFGCWTSSFLDEKSHLQNQCLGSSSPIYQGMNNILIWCIKKNMSAQHHQSVNMIIFNTNLDFSELKLSLGEFPPCYTPLWRDRQGETLAQKPEIASAEVQGANNSCMEVLVLWSQSGTMFHIAIKWSKNGKLQVMSYLLQKGNLCLDERNLTNLTKPNQIDLNHR